MLSDSPNVPPDAGRSLARRASSLVVDSNAVIDAAEPITGGA